VKGGFELGSAIALSPDGSTIALLHQPRNDDWSQFKPYRLTLIDLASGRASDLPGEFEGGLCWAADGKSLFLTGTVGTVLQRSLVPAEPARLIAHGRGPLLSEDGKSLLFSPPSQPPREWTGVAWRTSWTYLRWTIGTTEEAEALPVRIAAGGEVVAVSADGLIVHESEPDERLPLEHSGFLMRGPYWRGGISVFDPAGGTTEPLFVGIAPNSIQWRWD
jgi:hypothetical protein